MKRRQFLKNGASSPLVVLCGGVGAQTSSDPLRLVIPFPPGGGTDVRGRAIASRLEIALKRPVIVDNRSGAAGVIGTEFVAKSAKDGRTMLFAGIVPMPKLYAAPEALNDLAPICAVARSSFMLVVHPGVPVKTLTDLVRLAKTTPDALNFGSPGSASPQHIAMEMFNAAAGIDITQVTYRGAGPIITDLIGGQTQGTVATVAAIESFVSSGKVRALAVTGATRWEKMPEIPTIAESGYPGFQVDIGFATFVAAGTPRNIVLGLNAGIRDVLGQKEMRDKLADLGFSPVPGTPEELGMAVRREMEAVRSLIKTGRVKIDS